MAAYALRVLIIAEFSSGWMRLWDGSGGPFVDADGNIYRSCQLTKDALKSIQAAINGTAYTLPLSLINIPGAFGDQAWTESENSDVIGTTLRILLQEVDEYGQPLGDADTAFTGEIDNLTFSDAASKDGVQSTINLEVTNKFTLRNVTNGSVLSDVDQKARSALLNPSAPPDESCKLVPTMHDLTIRWPNW